MAGKNILHVATVLLIHLFPLAAFAEGVKMQQDKVTIDCQFGGKPALAGSINDSCSFLKPEKPPSYAVGLFGSACCDGAHGSGSYAAGVMGIANGDPIDEPDGAYGVYGKATYGSKSYGVYGEGKTSGIYGTGEYYGIYGVSSSSLGHAGHFVNTDQTASAAPSQVGVYVETYWGNLIEAWETLSVSPNKDRRFFVSRSGEVYADGTFHGGGADLAESVIPFEGKNAYQPGNVLEISLKAPEGTHTFDLSNVPYSTRVAGIYSTQPGFLGKQWDADDPRLKGEIPMAIAGIVPCLVSAENGPIERGDLLVSASEPGHAMKGTDRLRMIGAVVGKALGNLKTGTGMIDILVTLQ